MELSRETNRYFTTYFFVFYVIVKNWMVLTFSFFLAMALINGVILSNQQLFCNVYVKITSWMVLIFQTANVVSRGKCFTLEITLSMIVVRGIFRNNLITICKVKTVF